MKIAFTLCSNNYLAHAKTLYDSFVKHNPDYIFYIGLVDEVVHDIQLIPSEILIPVKQVLDTQLFDEMSARYNIIEFNTAVKPYYIQYLFEKFKDVDILIYLDPDIIVHGSFVEVENEIGTDNILITPHITKAYGIDNHLLSEMTFLSYGIFNLGFIAIRNYKDSKDFVVWWQERLRTHCLIDFAEGLFTDQKWINYVPVFFKGVKISFHLGLNAAYWNLHERQIKAIDNGYVVNDKFPLVFFHISGFDPAKPKQISKVQTRINISTRTDDAWKIYEDYSFALIGNGSKEMSKYPYAYKRQYLAKKKERLNEYVAANRNTRLIYGLYKALPGFVHRMLDAYIVRMKMFRVLYK